ncbi:MAG: hypothetical protein WD738_12860 [Pirellulales bacterium]
MGKIIKILLVLVTYVCIATVITLAGGLGYLWHTDRLDDEKVFRIMALLHDIDLNQISEAHRKGGAEVPPEEPSLTEVSHRQQVLDRNHEVKLLALQAGRQEYQHWFQQLKEQADRNHRQAQELQDKLKQQEQLTTQENVAEVVSQLEQLKPDKGKELLMRWIDEGRMDDAILLMSRMTETKLSKILKSFETEKELDKLHEIHQRIMGRGAGTSQLQKALGELGSKQGAN